jgi:hypothetical protein
MGDLQSFRNRDILSFCDADIEIEMIKGLFNDFLPTLEIADGKSKGRRSPVAVAKTLHLLAPAFFPLWDDMIERAYDCHYQSNPSEKYLSFLLISKQIAGRREEEGMMKRMPLATCDAVLPDGSRILLSKQPSSTYNCPEKGEGSPSPDPYRLRHGQALMGEMPPLSRPSA